MLCLFRLRYALFARCARHSDLLIWHRKLSLQLNLLDLTAVLAATFYFGQHSRAGTASLYVPQAAPLTVTG